MSKREVNHRSRSGSFDLVKTEADYIQEDNKRVNSNSQLFKNVDLSVQGEKTSVRSSSGSPKRPR